MVLTPSQGEYELILRNPINGEPILDNDGNTMAIRRAVSPFDAVTDADKAIDSEVYSGQGVIGISITGLNMADIPATSLVSVAFSVDVGLEDGVITTVVGLGEENAIGIPMARAASLPPLHPPPAVWKGGSVRNRSPMGS